MAFKMLWEYLCKKKKKINLILIPDTTVRYYSNICSEYFLLKYFTRVCSFGKYIGIFVANANINKTEYSHVYKPFR